MNTIPQILWGTNLENVLQAGWPLDTVAPGRSPREGSEFIQAPSGVEDASIIGYDYELQADWRWFGLIGDMTLPVKQSGYSTPQGLQAFLDWARAKNVFSFCPDKTIPTYTLPGCYLVAPMKGPPAVESDGSLSIKGMQFRNPSADFSDMLRGVQFEYGAGSSDAQTAVSYTFSRTSGATYHGVDGLVHTVGNSVLRDRHYFKANDGNTYRMTLIERQSTNICLQSQTFGTTWTNNVCTLTSAAGTGPDGTNTASTLIPNNTGANNNPYATQSGLTITSGEFTATSIYVKADGYNAIVLRFSDTTSTNGYQASFDLVNGVFGTLGNGFGAGVLTGKAFQALANGWYRVMIWGQVNAGVVSGQIFCYVYDTIAHANTQTAYTASGTAGAFAWGAQVERNGTTTAYPPTSYVATTTGSVQRNADVYQQAWTQPSMATFFYIKFVEQGTLQGASGNPRLFEISKFGTNPRLMVYVSGGKYTMAWLDANGVQTGPQMTTVPVFGDEVELFGYIDATGHMLLNWSINGAADTSSGVVNPTGAAPGPNYGTQVLGVGSDGGGGSLFSQDGYITVKIMAPQGGIMPASIAQARAA